jgi:hypothetical protein
MLMINPNNRISLIITPYPDNRIKESDSKIIIVTAK